MRNKKEDETEKEEKKLDMGLEGRSKSRKAASTHDHPTVLMFYAPEATPSDGLLFLRCKRHCTQGFPPVSP